MPILRVNISNGTPSLRRGGALDQAIVESLKDIPDGAPIVVMLHGYRFSPETAYSDPHRHILALKPKTGCRKAISWPRHMGFGRGKVNEGLCIAVGWDARGTIWQAWRNATKAAAGLAELITRVQSVRAQPVHILSHSLGARVVLRSFAKLETASVGRVILMSAAEYQSNAAQALATPAGKTCALVNVTSHENDLFDKGIEWLMHPLRRGDRMLGAGLRRELGAALNIQIDCARTRQVLDRFGHKIPPPVARVCHWSSYLRPGLFGLYRDLIRAPEAVPIEQLRDALPRRRADSWSWRQSLSRIADFRAPHHKASN